MLCFCNISYLDELKSVTSQITYPKFRGSESHKTAEMNHYKKSLLKKRLKIILNYFGISQ